MKNLANKTYWKNLEFKSLKQIMNIEFSELFYRYLRTDKKNSQKTMLEIGCSPARFLAYIAKYFHYYPEGIDYLSRSKLICEETLRNMGVHDFKIFEEDFLAWRFKKKYDLVCSFGFIEHFSNPEIVIRKHISVTKKSGIVIIGIPNFGGWQKLLHSKLDKNNFLRHNISIMNLDYFDYICRKYNIKKLYSNYHGGLFDFWWNNKNPSPIQRIAYIILRIIARAVGKLKLNNKYLSPYIIFIGRVS